MRDKRKIANTLFDATMSMTFKNPIVGIDEFVCSEEYLGKTTNNGDLVFPVWKDALRKMFDDDSKTLVVLTGAIGTGKTTVAVIALAYVMYKLLSLVNAWAFFEKTESGKMAITFFNLTKSLGDSRGFGKLQSFLTNSPWFMDACKSVPRTRNRVEYLDFPLFRYVLASPYARGFGTVGEDVVCGIMDEVDSPSESAKNKHRVLKAYEATVRRFKSRFVKRGYSFGRLFLVASKQDDLSFIETFITKMKSSGEILIFDIPLWKAQPKSYFVGGNFKVAIGDAYHSPQILKPEDKAEDFIEDGYKLLEIPVEYEDEFRRDLVGCLRDIAGVSIGGLRKSKLFPSESSIKDCFDDTKEDPVNVPLIKIGLKDDVRLMWYMDLDKIRVGKEVERYIHCDISFSGDVLGLAMCGVRGWAEVDTEKEEGTFTKVKEPIVETDFIMGLKAREGDRIPLFAVRRFVLDLRKEGYRVNFSADLKLASEDTTQLLEKAGIPCKYISVDRTDEAYLVWRNMVFGKRWVCHTDSGLFFEAKHLEHDLQSCFTGDTMVSLVSGEEISMLDLVERNKRGEVSWVYSMDFKRKRLVQGRVKNPRRTRREVKIIKVILDNNEVIKCTPDHKFMLRDGSFKEAQQLASGESLMPLYRKGGKGGYRQWKNVFTGRWCYEHRYFMACSRDKLVHHKNYVKEDNRLCNLQIMSKKAHARFHAKYDYDVRFATEVCKRRADTRRKTLARMKKENPKKYFKMWEGRNVKRWKKIHSSKEWKLRCRRFELIKVLDRMKCRANYFLKEKDKVKRLSLFSYKDFLSLLANHANSCRKKGKKMSQQERKNISMGIRKTFREGRKTWNKGKTKDIDERLSRVADKVKAWHERMKGTEVYEKRNEKCRQAAVKQSICNHTVKEVIWVDEPQDVYDFEVPVYHNFALSAEVFVHNCKVDHPDEVKDIEILENGDMKDVVMKGTKDKSDAVVGSLWNCLKNLKEPMDVGRMGGLMKRLSSSQKDEGVARIMRFKDSEGQEVSGIKEGDKVKALKDLFKKLR